MTEEQKISLIRVYENEFDAVAKELVDEIKTAYPKSKSEFDSMSESKTNRLDSAMQKFAINESRTNGIDSEVYFSITKSVFPVKMSHLNLRLEELKAEILGD